MKIYINNIALILVLFLNTSCIEEINIAENTDFESVLVVNAVITNELKFQEIKLSRTFPLGTEDASLETGANVSLITNNEVILFFEEQPGTYKSSNSFAALPDIEYQLEIRLSDGETYRSNLEALTQQTSMDDLYVSRDFNENEDEGVSIYVDAYDPSGNSKFYRFEFEETYKIIAPNWVNEDLSCVPNPETGSISFVYSLRSLDEIICYNTVKSNKILITNTNGFDEDRLEQFRLRFINRDNYIISHRYSIEVKQYVVSQEAYRYYEILKDISSSENLFSQNQVGYIEGNLKSVNKPNKKVLGYFEVSSVDVKRIYFNYEDLFPNEILPPYVINCVPFSPDPRFICDALSESQGNKYYGPNDNPDPSQSYVYLIAGECGNCKVLGESTPPDFWED